jgi:peptide/nickel transport system ATP-binding protein
MDQKNLKGFKMDNKTLLTVNDLKIEGFQNDQWLEIVHGISFTLNKGEVLGLIGESGAGKSTIGLATMGFYRAGCRNSGGEIILAGKTVTRMGRIEKRQLRGDHASYVAQSAAASFNPAHRIINQFSEVPVLRHIMTQAEARKHAVELYKKLMLPAPETIGFRYPHQLSGGQLQRAMTAMAMGPNPEIIIFDEPTTALDVTTQIEVLLSIKQAIKNHDTAAIYITHDLAVVAQLADRIMVLRHGKMIEEGETQQIITNPKENYTRELLNVRAVRKKKEAISNFGDTIVEIKNLSGGYSKNKEIIHDINLNVYKGRTLAIVGESGSGKSTLARAIIGLLPHLEGEALFEGNSLPKGLKGRSRELLRKIQMIYQIPDVALNPRQRVRTIIGHPLKAFFNMPSKDLKQRVQELLEMVELPRDYIDRLPRELSGGEKQRVCIARALAAEPTVIICDEVTSALDQLIGKQILDMLQNLQKKMNMTYIYITHDIDTVRIIANEVAVMRLGKIVEVGDKETIFKPPYHEYTELLLSSVPQMDPNWIDSVIHKRGQTQQLKTSVE